ncbi:hypothetical protein I316_06026 [Kwoniella heveanensis BCC8398]|uniref:Uncharacterized protein n=1 Tax=Kwoniella heveanensis BCC8398 TaxID=1296120 RepID=A0A1B9GMX6_9TREE|nr:hypothetical protein I316_06026 [Kwoniella heveanensis BCC8398]
MIPPGRVHQAVSRSSQRAAQGIHTTNEGISTTNKTFASRIPGRAERRPPPPPSADASRVDDPHQFIPDQYGTQYAQTPRDLDTKIYLARRNSDQSSQTDPTSPVSPDQNMSASWHSSDSATRMTGSAYSLGTSHSNSSQATLAGRLSTQNLLAISNETGWTIPEARQAVLSAASREVGPDTWGLLKAEIRGDRAPIILNPAQSNWSLPIQSGLLSPVDTVHEEPEPQPTVAFEAAHLRTAESRRKGFFGSSKADWAKVKQRLNSFQKSFRSKRQSEGTPSPAGPYAAHLSEAYHSKPEYKVTLDRSGSEASAAVTRQGSSASAGGPRRMRSGRRRPVSIPSRVVSLQSLAPSTVPRAISEENYSEVFSGDDTPSEYHANWNPDRNRHRRISFNTTENPDDADDVKRHKRMLREWEGRQTSPAGTMLGIGEGTMPRPSMPTRTMTAPNSPVSGSQSVPLLDIPRPRRYQRDSNSGTVLPSEPSIPELTDPSAASRSHDAVTATTESKGKGRADWI